MYKVFINDIPLILTDSEEEFNKAMLLFRVRYFSDEVLTDMVEFIENSNKPGMIYHSNLNELWQGFTNQYKVIKAGGGIVKNGEGDYLAIYRRDVWDLPKGKLEINESIESAAVREVEEECGLKNVKLGSYIGTTYHLFKKNTLIKESHWYAMTVDGKPVLLPQLEEDITEVKWLNKIEFLHKMSESHQSITEFIEANKNNL